MLAMLRRWFVKHHGEGEHNQYDFYRCDQCHGIVTWRMIRLGGCGCSRSRLRPTNPTMVEAFKLLVLPWTIK